MVNFLNGKIYTIRSRSRPDLVYIGSTTQTLAQRLGKHRNGHRRYKNGTYSYMTSFQILDIGDEYIELLEDFQCTSKDQLLKREGELIRATECVNRIMPGRTKKQYNQDNKQAISAWHKQYRIDNNEQLLASMKQYRIENREAILAWQKQRINCDYCDCTFSSGNKLRHIKSPKHITNYKAAYLKCWDEPFEGLVTSQDY